MSLDERLERALDDYRALVAPVGAGDEVPRPAPNPRRPSILALAAAIVVGLLVVGAVVVAGRGDDPTSLDTAGHDGPDGATPSTDGPVGGGGQVGGGDGWWLLGDDLTGPSYRTGVATTVEQYRSLWAEAGLTTEAPEVDLARDVVVWFGAVYGSSCPIRLDDIGVDLRPAVVYPVTVVPGGQTECTMDARPHAFVVAVERRVLPPGPFVVQLGPEDPPPGAPEERTVVRADLSVPGSTASAASIGFDPILLARSDVGPPTLLGSGSIMDLDDGWTYAFPAACGARILGILNGVLWESDEVPATGELPPAWVGAVGPDGVVTVTVTLAEEGPTVTAGAGGTSITYRPSGADPTPYRSSPGAPAADRGPCVVGGF